MVSEQRGHALKSGAAAGTDTCSAWYIWIHMGLFGNGWKCGVSQNACFNREENDGICSIQCSDETI